MKECIRYSEEFLEKGDVYHAIHYLEKALEIDSNSVDLNWRMAQAQRLYKDYRKAEYYYQKVYLKEGAKLFPQSIYYLALMQEHNGKYEEAKDSWKRAKKIFMKQRNAYENVRSRQGYKNALWLKQALKDTTEYIIEQLPTTVNTPNSEFGHSIVGNQLVYSSLLADSVSSDEIVFTDNYKMRLYTSEMKDSSYLKSQLLKDLEDRGFSVGNGSLSADGKRFYFSKCTDQSYKFQCKIYVARVENGKFTDIDELGDMVNEEGSNNTQPNIAKYKDGEILFFASDREDKKSQGQMDIWYVLVTDGNQYSKAYNAGRVVNTEGNEVTPFFDSDENVLYFSSDFHFGFGGFDIQKAVGMVGSFQKVDNVGLEMNSSAQDLYFFKDSKTGEFYFSSNRIGSLYAKNPTCCHDIYKARIPAIPEVDSVKEETLFDLNKRLPVTLYFHNDRPGPKSIADTIELNYMTTYERYTAMKEKYKTEYSKGLTGDKADEAKEDIADFFLEYVDQGVKDLYWFSELLLKELQKGKKIRITIKGFASPLAPTAYNVHLTRRRIVSLKNFLWEYQNGVFQPYMSGTSKDGGIVKFNQNPFGEYTADKLISDNPNDLKNSIYNRKAALERKVEIQSVDLIQEDSTGAEVTFAEEVHDFGTQKIGVQLKYTFEFRNDGNEDLIIEDIEIPCECNTATVDKKTIKPGEKAFLTMTFDTKGYDGHAVKSVYLITNGIPPKKRIVFTVKLVP
ncbi:MAG: DUF1573 domain-containing protein [Crocinitomicaceae bacterium]